MSRQWATRIWGMIMLCGHIWGIDLQGQTTVQGQVVDATSQEPLVGAYLSIVRNAAEGCLTDTSGIFSLSVQPTDTLVCSYIGYASQRLVVKDWPEGGRLIQLSARLQLASEVVVRAKRISSAELASSTVNRLDIYQNVAAKADPLLAVNTLPAATTPDESANVSLRGSTTGATGIYLNNVPIRDAVRLDQTNGIGQFSLFNTANLQSVRVFPGNPPVEFAQAAAGVVALYTSSEPPRTNLTQFSLGLAGGGVNLQRPLGEKAGINLFGNFQGHAAFTGLNGNALADIQNFRNVDLGAHLQMTTGNRARLDVFQLAFGERYAYRVRSGALNDIFQQNRRRLLTVINYHWETQSGNHWEINQGIDWSRATYSIGNISSEPRELDLYTGILVRRSVGKSSTTYGLQLTNRYQKVNGRFPSNENAIRSTDPSETFTSNSREWLPEAYWYGQFYFGNRWLLGAGAKVSHRMGEADLRPGAQLGLRFLLGSQSRILLGVGQYQKFVSPGPDRQSEAWLNSRQVSVEWHWTKDSWSSQLAVFRKTDRFGTEEEWQIYGGEYRLVIQRGNWSWEGSFTAVQSQIHRGALNFPSRYDHPFLIRSNLRLTLPWDITAGWFLQSRRGGYFLPLERATFDAEIERFVPEFAPLNAGQRYPNYWRMDLGLTRMFPVKSGIIIAFFNLNNLSDQRNTQAYAYSEDYSERTPVLYGRRVWFAGMVWQFGPGEK